MVDGCGRMVDQNPALGSLPENSVGNHAVWTVEEVWDGDVEGEARPLDVHHEEICCLCGGLGTDSFWWDQGRLHRRRALTGTIDPKIQRKWFIQEGLCSSPKFLFLLCSSTSSRIITMLGCRCWVITQRGRRRSSCPLLLGSHQITNHILH